MVASVVWMKPGYRVTQILYNGATSCVYTSGNCLTFVYDADGNQTSRHDATGTATYYYDTLNRLTTESLPSAANACSGSSPSGITYTWDAESNVTSYCDAGGAVTYSYDGANRMTGLATDGGNCTSGPVVQPCTTYGYSNANQVTSITLPTAVSVTETLGYNNAGQETSVTVKHSGTTIDSFSYVYTQSTNDRPMLQSSVNGSATTAYRYDVQERLCWAYTGTTTVTSCATPPTGADSYTYDADNNLLTTDLAGTTHTMTYTAADELCWA